MDDPCRSLQLPNHCQEEKGGRLIWQSFGSGNPHRSHPLTKYILYANMHNAVNGWPLLVITTAEALIREDRKEPCYPSKMQIWHWL